MKYDKEQYISASSNVEDWRGHINAKVIDRYKDIVVGEIADFGCNHGACTRIISENPKVKRVVGFDVNEKAIKLARKENRNDKTTYRVQDLASPELGGLRKDSYDGAYSFHTLEHIYPEDVRAFLGNLAQLLKPDSPLVISIPFEHHHDDPNHQAWYDKDSLKSVMEDSGYTTVEIIQEDGDTGTILTGLFLNSRLRK